MSTELSPTPGRRIGETLTLAPQEKQRLQPLIPQIHAAKTRYYGLRVGLGRVQPRSGVKRLKKPAPDVYLRALATLDLAASQAIAVEDSAIGVKAAKAAGLFTLVTPSAWTCNEDFSSADLVLPSLADLTLD